MIKKNFKLIIYVLVILWCITISQKLPGVQNSWVLLYQGIILLSFGTMIIISKSLLGRSLKIYDMLGFTLYVLLVLYIGFDTLYISEIRNSYFLRIILIHVFPITIIYLQRRNTIYEVFHTIASILIIFSIVSAIIAWYLYFGGTLTIYGLECKTIRAYYPRIHGIIGEPVHFGLLQGICLISAIFLYRNYNNSKSHYIPNIYILNTIIVIMLISMIFSGTRNAFISTAAGLFIYYIYDKKVRYIINNLALISIIPAVISVIIFYYESQLVSGLVSTMRVADESIESNNIRLDRLDMNLELIANFNFNEMIFGLGWERALKSNTSFNQYIDIIRNFGILWSMLGLTLLATVVIKYLNLLKHNNIIYIYPLAILAYSLTCFLVYTPLDNVFHIVTFVFVYFVLLSFNIRNKA